MRRSRNASSDAFRSRSGAWKYRSASVRSWASAAPQSRSVATAAARSALRYLTSTSSIGSPLICDPRASAFPKSKIGWYTEGGHLPKEKRSGPARDGGEVGGHSRGRGGGRQRPPEGRGDLPRQRGVARHRRHVPAHGRVALRRVRRGRVRDLPVALLAVSPGRRRVGRQPEAEGRRLPGPRGRRDGATGTAGPKVGDSLRESSSPKQQSSGHTRSEMTYSRTSPMTRTRFWFAAAVF